MEQNRVESITLEKLDGLIEHYFNIQQEKVRLEMALQINKDAILKRFAEAGTGMRTYQTNTGISATVSTQVRQSISVKESEALLPSDLFNKLVKTSSVVILIVRERKV